MPPKSHESLLHKTVYFIHSANQLLGFYMRRDIFYNISLHNIFSVAKKHQENFEPKFFFCIGTGNEKINPLLPGVAYLYPLNTKNL